jgi:hypothetical protein
MISRYILCYIAGNCQAVTRPTHKDYGSFVCALGTLASSSKP